MSLQFILDNNGNTTGVFIPIEEWQSMKDTYTGLQKEEVNNNVTLSTKQKDLIDDRLNDYYQNSSSMMDFDSMLDDIEHSL